MDTLGCTSCGATLPFQPGDTAVVCRFCGRSTAISARRAEQPIELKPVLRRPEEEGLNALDASLPRVAPPTPTELGLLLGLCALTGVAAVSSPRPGTGLGLALDALFAALNLLALGAGAGALVWLVHRAASAGRRATWLLAAQRRYAETTPRLSRCPQCNGGVQAPTGATELACARCEALLLVADGLVVARVKQRERQVKLWRDAAHATWADAVANEAKRLRASSYAIAAGQLATTLALATASALAS